MSDEMQQEAIEIGAFSPPLTTRNPAEPEPEPYNSNEYPPLY